MIWEVGEGDSERVSDGLGLSLVKSVAGVMAFSEVGVSEVIFRS